VSCRFVFVKSNHLSESRFALIVTETTGPFITPWTYFSLQFSAQRKLEIGVALFLLFFSCTPSATQSPSFLDISASSLHFNMICDYLHAGFHF